MNIRQPVRAGSFYEASALSCRHHAGKLLASVEWGQDLPINLFGGLVPHAGWAYSGRLAATVFKALDTRQELSSIVLLGADHTGSATAGEVYDSGLWRTPLGDAPVDEELASALLASDPRLHANGDAHNHEHSIEVQIPILQTMNPDIQIVPIAMAPTTDAAEIGAAIGKTLAKSFPNSTVVGSTDLTHHAGHFPAPGGRGEQGVKWSVKNDRRLLDLIEQMAVEKIVPEVAQRGNACGAGAIAATMAACRELGATRGICLEHTNSYEIVHAIYPNEPDDTTVGYAAVVFA